MAIHSTLDDTLLSVADELSEFGSFRDCIYCSGDGVPFPSWNKLSDIVELIRSILFPGYFGSSYVDTNTIRFHMGVDIERLNSRLCEQVLAGLCFDCHCNAQDMEPRRQEARRITTDFIRQLPQMRAVLLTDIEASYNGDPAAKSHGEIILCYPTLKAVSSHRIAHALLNLGVPLIPRMITEIAHSETGIDIHPGATIGHHFSIDHGTGVVVGETAVIGNNVKLYQGVTLGARSFQLDQDGNPVKNVLRHPIVEDDVIIYSNASILGRITIGRGAVIGGNVWLTHDVLPGEKIFHAFGKQFSNTVDYVI